MGNKAKFVERMLYWCNEADLGYDQSNRWDIREHGECDCSSLVYWCLWEAGYGTKPANPYSQVLYTGTLGRDLISMGFTKLPNDGHPQVGDVCLNDVNHVAVCTGPNGQLSFASIDENGRATGGQSGDQTGAETKTRSYYNYPWNAYYRPPADSGSAPSTPSKPTPSTPSTPSTNSGKIAEDGYWGPGTTRKLQQVLGTTVDGIVSGQMAVDFNAINKGGLGTNTFQIGSGGSKVIKALQKKVGANSDGYFGPKSVRALQSYLGTSVDGVVSGPSAMVKAMQKKLNTGKL